MLGEELMICSIKERGKKKPLQQCCGKAFKDRTVRACETAVTIVTGSSSFINECGEFGDVQSAIAAL